jgi:hypothetical protein
MIPSAPLDRLAATLEPALHGPPEITDMATASACIEELTAALRGLNADLREIWAAAAHEPGLAKAAYELGAALGEPVASAMQRLATEHSDGSLAQSRWTVVNKVEAIITARPESAYDCLGPLIALDALGNDGSAALVGEILGSVRLRPELGRDGRWRALALRLESHPKLGGDARDFLEHLPRPASAPATTPALAPALARLAPRLGSSTPPSAAAATIALRKAAFAARRAVSLLGRAWGASPASSVARRALAEIGHAAAADAAWFEEILARAPLGASPPGPDPSVQAQSAAAALIALDPPSAHGRLAFLYEPSELGTKTAVACALAALPAVGSPLYSEDPRWASACARLLAHPQLRAAARERLASLGEKLRDAALASAGVVPPVAPVRSKAPLPARRDFLARYQGGAHEEVWRELVALGEAVRDPALAEEARAVALAIMERLRANLERIFASLRAHGYELRQGKKALGKRADASKLVSQCEKLVGGAVPLSLEAFWSVVGHVDLGEGEAGTALGSPFDGLGEEDPLVVCSAKEALEDLKDAQRVNKGLPAVLQEPMTFMLAPDADAKADPDMGTYSPLRVRLPDPGVDATLLVPGRADESFVAYLRRAVARGGFLALDRAGDGRGLRLLTEDVLPF